MNKRLKYSGTDKMSDLICENYNLLLVMSRFGLSLGFGDQTVQQVCERQGVHTGTFLAVVNFMDGECCVSEEFHDQISVEALMEYLKQAHSYFLDYNLPVIRRRLIDAIDCSQDDVAFLILKFYDEYVNEVRAHMGYENEVVFKYVNALLQGEDTGRYNIGVFVARHNQIETKLTELKNIIVKYYPSRANNNLLNTVLFDIYSCSGLALVLKRIQGLKILPIELVSEESLDECVRFHKPEILIVNPSFTGYFDVRKFKETPQNAGVKCIALMCSVADQGVLRNYDESLTIYDDADTIREKLNRLLNVPGEETEEELAGQEVLSSREKEIITCVVKGMTNKEIADALYLSAHTVITHRRNIARKLQIHSPAGLTIYAIVNKLVELQDIKEYL